MRAPGAAPLAAGSSSIPAASRVLTESGCLLSYSHISPGFFSVRLSSPIGTSGAVTVLECLKTRDHSHSERRTRMKRAARGQRASP